MTSHTPFDDISNYQYTWVSPSQTVVPSFNQSFDVAAYAQLSHSRPPPATVEPPRKRRRTGTVTSSIVIGLTDEEQPKPFARTADGKAVAFKDLSDELLLNSCLSHEQICAWQFSNRGAECWKHFRKTLVVIDGDILYHLDCRFNNPDHDRRTIKRSKLDQGSSNFNKQIEKCGMGNERAAEAAQPYQYNEARHRAICALRAAANKRPYAMQDDPWYLMEVELLRPGIVAPCSKTVARDVGWIYCDYSSVIRWYFEKRNRMVHSVVDGWTAPIHTAYLGAGIQWEQDAEIYFMILEFIRLDESHTGKNLAYALNECFKKYGLDKFLYILTMDNAGNCNTTATELAKINDVFRGTAWRGRCDLHIIQIAAKMVISWFNKPAKRKSRKVKVAVNDVEVEEVTIDGPTAEQEEDAEMQRLLDDDAADRAAVSSQTSPNADARDAHDDAVVSKLREQAIKYMSEEKHITVSTAEAKIAVQLLPRVTGLAKKTHESNTVAAAFAKLVADDKSVVGDIRTLATRCASRWNTDYDSLDSIMKLKGPVVALLANVDLNLRAYKLTDNQWDLTRDLRDLLDCFKDVTLKLSNGGDKRPLACDVIPSVEDLRNDLLSASKTDGLATVCRVAAYGGVLVLEKYLPLLMKCEAYVFGIVFRPDWKTKWFEERGRTAPEIQRIKKAVIARFKDFKPQYDNAASSVAPRSSSSSTPAPVSGRARFSTAKATAPVAPTQILDCIESYLETPPIDLHRKPLLQYWHEQRSLQPHVAEMALTVLSAPATSVDAERAFSEGRNQCAWNQHAMSSQTFREQMSVGAWARAPFFDLGIAEKIIEEHSRAMRGPSSTQ